LHHCFLYAALEYVKRRVQRNSEVAEIDWYRSVDICAGDNIILDGSIPVMKKEFGLAVNTEKI